MPAIVILGNELGKTRSIDRLFWAVLRQKSRRPDWPIYPKHCRDHNRRYLELTVEFIDQIPFSNIYRDVYFSREDGLAESRHVFLNGNDLPERWSKHVQFTIGETGFGTGLNFLATWQCWRRYASTDSRLHFISVENHPLTVSTLKSCHALFPELKSLSEELCRHWPGALKGFHRCILDRGRIILTLCHGEASQVLQELVASVDCWYLDGFAPAKNPNMWSNAVFREIARLSGPGTTFATFTVAGSVRSQLAAQGFCIRRIKGFGKKREMLAGVLQSRPKFPTKQPWFFPAAPVQSSKTATVLGAGIAGAQVAYHLANRGWEVTVLEQLSKPDTTASANPAAVFSPLLTSQPSLEEQLSLQSFVFLLSHFEQLDPQRRYHDRCGVLELAITAAQQIRTQKLIERSLPKWLIQPISRESAQLISAIQCPDDGVFFVDAGFLRPQKWIDELLLHPNIELRSGKKVCAIEPSKKGWKSIGQRNTPCSDSAVLILATGHAMQWPQTQWLPITPVSGQSTFIDSDLLVNPPHCIIRYGGCLVPLANGHCLIGSTFDSGCNRKHPDPQADLQNLNHLKQALPQMMNWHRKSSRKVAAAYRGVRAVGENRFPVVGALPKPNSFKDEFRRMHRRNYPSQCVASVYLPNLYVSAAWGSRGMTQAALGGEFLASWICDEPLPLQASLVHAIHPARSLVRSLKRRPI